MGIGNYIFGYIYLEKMKSKTFLLPLFIMLKTWQSLWLRN
jgi:hypothetical protein